MSKKNNADPTALTAKWKFGFFLLLGIVLGQGLGRLLFDLSSGKTGSTIYVVVNCLWLTILILGFWINLRKRKFVAAIVLGLGLAVFLVLFLFVAHIGFP